MLANTATQEAIPVQRREAGRRAGMLKISVVDTDQQRQLILEGALISPWAAELREVCEAARADLHGRKLFIQLQDLTAISQEGENVLVQLLNDGATLQCCGVFTKHVVNELLRRRYTPASQVIHR